MSEPTVADVGERALVRAIQHALGAPPEGTLGPGDDAAVLPRARGRAVLTVDALVEGTHFLRTWATPEDVGHKALAVSLSDVAAMGAVPRYALVALTVPPDLPAAGVLRLMRGVHRLARGQDVVVVGGNVTRGERISVTLTVQGELASGHRPWLRSGARVGDAVFVTGVPGLARLGHRLLEQGGAQPLSWGRERTSRTAPAGAWARRAVGRFLRPVPRTDLVPSLRTLRPHAVMDVSDGLAMDLDRLAELAGGIRVEAARLEPPPGLAELAGELGEDPVANGWIGGEDYELVIAVPHSRISVRESGSLGGQPLTRIGEVVGGAPGVDGLPETVRGRSFTHFGSDDLLGDDPRN